MILREWIRVLDTEEKRLASELMCIQRAKDLAVRVELDLLVGVKPNVGGASVAERNPLQRKAK